MLGNKSVIGKYISILVMLIEFANIDSGCPSLRLPNGRVQIRNNVVEFKCRKSYQLVGSKHAYCLNGKWDSNLPICIKRGCGVPWFIVVNGHLLESYKGAIVKVVCYPGYSIQGSHTVYCDGIRWNQSFPVCKVANNNPALSCDFESEDLCGWSQDPLQGMFWNRTAVADTKIPPFSDHSRSGAKGSGHYMKMIKPPESAKENKTARLYSPVYPAELSKGRCFAFWFYMDENRTETLKIFVKPVRTELELIPLVWMNEDHGNSWQQYFFEITPTDAPFQIVIEGIEMPDSSNHMAFDDVKITSVEECNYLKNAMTSTEFFTTVSRSDDADDESVLFSCRNRCNQGNSSSVGGNGFSCDCREECVRANNCCKDFFTLCAPVGEPSSTSTVTKSTRDVFTSAVSKASTAKKGDFEKDANVKIIPTKSSFEVTKTKAEEKNFSIKPIHEVKLKNLSEFQSTTTPRYVAPEKSSGNRFSHPTSSKKSLNEWQPNELASEKGRESPEAIKIKAHEESEEESKKKIQNVAAITSVLFLVISLALGLVWYRRRINRKLERGNSTEDSDVRFLTSDEVLDFTLARPADDN